MTIQLRQICLVARDLDATIDNLEQISLFHLHGWSQSLGHFRQSVVTN